MSTVLASRERHVLGYALVGLVAGVGLGLALPLAAPIARALEVVSEAYGFVAPLLLYAILAPSLLKLVKQAGAGGAWFCVRATLWFARVRLLACAFAVVGVSVAFRLSLCGKAEATCGDAARGAVHALARVAVESGYSHAIYAAILTVVVLRRRDGALVRRFVDLPLAVERFGRLFTRVVPLFTFLMGLYIVSLPAVLASRLRTDHGLSSGRITLLGFDLDAATDRGLFGVYAAIALLTGALCAAWHLVLLVWVKARRRGFSISSYLGGYFFKLYPMLWATCSEALGLPLSLYLCRTSYPDVDGSVRHVAIGAGSMFNVNGTLTCCFVMIPAVSMLLGLDVSVLSLLLCFPVIYVIGFGIPGIPGELVLFAGPIASVLNVPEGARPAFIAAFIALQIGLPDSFRSAANSTDGGPSALLLNEVYRRSPAGGAAG